MGGASGDAVCVVSGVANSDAVAEPGVGGASPEEPRDVAVFSDAEACDATDETNAASGKEASSTTDGPA